MGAGLCFSLVSELTIRVRYTSKRVGKGQMKGKLASSFWIGGIFLVIFKNIPGIPRGGTKNATETQNRKNPSSSVCGGMDGENCTLG